MKANNRRLFEFDGKEVVDRDELVIWRESLRKVTRYYTQLLTRDWIKPSMVMWALKWVYEYYYADNLTTLHFGVGHFLKF